MAATINSSNNGSNNPRKILIVDDEPDITLSFDMILQMNGFEVDTMKLIFGNKAKG
jgi:DNA-binding NtrC family response regulator